MRKIIPYMGQEPDRRAYAGIRPKSVLRLFRAGMDTAAIARKFYKSEALICAALTQARDAERATK